MIRKPAVCHHMSCRIIQLHLPAGCGHLLDQIQVFPQRIGSTGCHAVTLQQIHTCLPQGTSKVTGMRPHSFQRARTYSPGWLIDRTLE